MWGFQSLMKSKDVCPVMYTIGTDTDDGGMYWEVSTAEYCLMMEEAGVLENRGYTMLNGIMTWRYYLPPPQHTYTTGP